MQQNLRQRFFCSGTGEEADALQSRLATLCNAMGRDMQPPSDADMARISEIVRDVTGMECLTSDHAYACVAG